VVANAIRRRASAPLVERARLLGLPVAEAAQSIDPPVAPLRITVEGSLQSNRSVAPPRVVDLSSLWAGPLATHLLALTGARVIKVESAARPDGARRGPTAFYDLLNAGKESVALDFTSAEDRRALRRLIASADIVVEASRPRALRTLGIDAEQIVATSPGLVWVSITGYGRREPEANWVAFGDDAGVAAGLAMALAGKDGVPVFCSDAIADPLAGMHAAVAALACWQQRRSVLLDVALSDVVAYAASFSGAIRFPGASRTLSVAGDDTNVVHRARVPVRMPRARAARGRAAEIGADTVRVLAELEAAGC
jgi:crotonobetainyl-CoA:carnitine CoA-transferase CaiB-like acyl-CoA transferase